jgi:PleD family two-component response regulator
VQGECQTVAGLGENNLERLIAAAGVLQRTFRFWSDPEWTTTEMRILLVEDDREVAEYVRLGLEEEGNSVSVCHDGAGGLRAAGLTAFDIIVLDVMLPFMDGLEVTRRLRREKTLTRPGQIVKPYADSMYADGFP